LTDRLTGGRLINYRPYYFAVTAYSYDVLGLEEYKVGDNLLGYLTEDLETNIEGTEVRPSSVALDLVDTAAHAAGESWGSVTVRYFYPEQITGDDYEVTFNEDLTWNLQNLTTGTMLLADQDNISGDFDYPVVDNLNVPGQGPRTAVVVRYANTVRPDHNGHHITYDLPGPKHQYGCMLEDLAAGRDPVIIEGYQQDGPCQ